MSNTTHCTVPIENTKMLADALKAAGVTVAYDLLAAVGHGDTASTPVFESDANVKRVVAFFDAYVK
jgi:dipeptidyl aminopeptidase/acylaminoacyl peptidase